MENTLPPQSTPQLPKQKSRTSQMLSNHRTNKTGCAVQKSRMFIQQCIQCTTTKTVAKISENPGSNIVRCLHCNRITLLENCYIEMNINFHLENQKHHFSVTAFPKIVGNFLQEDILEYKDNIDDLTEKLLLLENVDFQLSSNN